MQPKAIIFGAVGTITEITELRRRALNRALERRGVGRELDMAGYAAVLEPEGRLQLGRVAAVDGPPDPEAVLRAANEELARLLESEPPTLRPGVADLVRTARERALDMALVCTAGVDTAGVVLSALSRMEGPLPFSLVGDVRDVRQIEPAPDIYLWALKRLSLAPEEMLAIADRPAVARAAMAARVPVVAFPGLMASGESFPPGCLRLSRLSPELLGGIQAGL